MTETLMPETSPQFDLVMKNVMLAKKEMGSAVKKDAANPFHKSRYASLGAHLELCESVLDKHGLILMQTINGSYEKAILIASLCHVESGQWIKSYLPLPNPKNDSQGLGASITYMRRYSISSMLGLNAEDDDGETASGRGKHDSYKKKAEVEAPKDPVDEESILTGILQLFEKDDQFMFVEYMDEVMKHFKWDKSKCIQEFFNDKANLKKKFEAWKKKNKLP